MSSSFWFNYIDVSDVEDELRKDATKGKQRLKSKLSGRSQHIQFEDDAPFIKRLKLRLYMWVLS